jgi:hypothetical protein
MTEAEWFADADPVALAAFAQERLSPRRARLLAVALCRSVGQLLAPDLAAALDVVGRYADGAAGAAELERARQTCRVIAVAEYENYTRSVEHQRGGDAAALLRHELGWAVAFAATDPVPVGTIVERVCESFHPSFSDTATARCRSLVREVAGNPFRPANFDPAWRTDTAVPLARHVYESEEFSALPILADSLQDAGCDSDEVLSHCRDARQDHVRGCWALDLVLGKG